MKTVNSMRKPYRQSTSSGPTKAQRELIRKLEALTGTSERNLSDMTRGEASDYIDILRFRENKRRGGRTVTNW